MDKLLDSTQQQLNVLLSHPVSIWQSPGTSDDQANYSPR